MELLQSLSLNPTHNPVELLKFALLASLNGLRSLLLTYPLNLILFLALIFLVVRRVVQPFRGKRRFQAVYQPLPHHDSIVEELKLIKK